MTVESNYDTFMAISQSGEGNSQHGTRWIFSIDEKRSTKIGKEVSVPDGWYVGRVLDFTGMECFEDVAIVQRERKLALSTSRRERSMDDIRRVNSAEARRLYGEFTGGEYASMREFCKDSDYDKSVVALSKLWKRYIPEFTPIRGKRFVNNRPTREEKEAQTKLYAESLYEEYITGDYSSLREFCRESEYDKTVVSLSKMFKKYVPEFEPKQGKMYS